MVGHDHTYLAHTAVEPGLDVWLDRDDVAVGHGTVVETAIRWTRSREPRRPGGRSTPPE